MRRLFAPILAVTLLVTLLSPTLALAADFNPHLIISDTDLTSSDTMSVADIQKFLDSQKGGIATMKFTDTDGTTKSAAEIIAAAAAEETINPRYLLVVLQKEQSLITTKNPTQKQLDWATGYGVCDSCSMDDPSIQKFRGFATQVRRSAGIMRYYYDNIAQGWIKKAGQSYLIDSMNVNPQSNATAFLYTYTPHISGNKNFWKLWNLWFTKVYPDGSLLQAIGDQVVYLIQQGKKRPFATKSALISRFDPNTILQVSPTDLSPYESSAPISLPNYSLVRTPSGMTYLLIDEQKHPIASQAVFKSIGYNPDEVIDVKDEDVAEFSNGTFITSASVYPLGALVQDKKTKSLYYIQNGVRRIVASLDIAKVTYPKKKILTLDTKQLSEYPLDTTPVRMKDGTLVAVKNSPFIYVISNGMRRYIPSDKVFKNLGYQTKNIFYTDEQTLAAIPEGEPLASDTAPTQAAGR